MRQVQYRFFKYLIRTLDRAISWLRLNPPDPVRVLWFSGIVHDAQVLCPVDLPNSLTEHIQHTAYDLCVNDDWHTLLTRLRDELLMHALPVIRADFMFARPVGAVHLVPIYNMFLADSRFVVNGVARQYSAHERATLSGDVWNEIEEALSNTPHITYKNYKVEEMLPDIVVETDPSDRSALPSRLTAPQLKAYTNRVVHIPHSLLPNDDIVFDTRYHAVYSSWLDCCVSRFFYESRRVTNHIDFSNSVLTGHPVFDISYSIRTGNSSRSIPSFWIEKQKSRLTILWNPDVTYEAYLIRLEAVLLKYPNVLVISRPKPTAPLEHKANDDKHELLAEKYDNLIIDKNIDYTFALTAADAYIGASSSLYVQFIALEKPAAIDLLYSSYDPAMLLWARSVFLHTLDDTFKFIDGLLSTDIPRHRALSKTERFHVGPCDGNNSKRVINAVLSKLYLEEKEFIDKFCPLLKPEELEI